jgi:hypothetical protein
MPRFFILAVELSQGLRYNNLQLRRGTSATAIRVGRNMTQLIVLTKGTPKNIFDL